LAKKGRRAFRGVNRGFPDSLAVSDLFKKATPAPKNRGCPFSTGPDTCPNLDELDLTKSQVPSGLDGKPNEASTEDDAQATPEPVEVGLN